MELDDFNDMGDEMVRLEMLPGRFAVEGVSRKDGRSTGGRGAGPGFMNWFGEYMLREGQQVITGCRE